MKAAHRTEEKVEISGGMKVSEAGKEKALSSYSRPMKLGFVGEQPAPPKLNLPKNGQPPKREVPVRKALESKVQTTAPINPSSYPFGGIPNSSVLRPKGHSRIDTGSPDFAENEEISGSHQQLWDPSSDSSGGRPDPGTVPEGHPGRV